MNREQAVNVIKQVFEQCRYIEGKSIKLMAPKENNALSNTFQIYIHIGNEDLLPTCVKNIAKENDLAVKQKDGYLIVYKPYPNLNEP